MIKITLKDGSVREYNEGITIKEVAESISAGLARVALAGEVNGEVKDLSYPLENDCTLNLLTFDDEGGRDAYRHTTSIYWHRRQEAVSRCKAGNRACNRERFLL